MIIAVLTSFALQAPVQAPPSSDAPPIQTPPLIIEVKGAPRGPVLSAEQVASGQATYVARCQLCHGKDGNADTAIGRAMKPPPQRFTDAVWQSKVSDAEIRKAILEGGPSVKKSAAMPAFPEYAQPAGAVEPLVTFIRSLRAPVAIINVMAGDEVHTLMAPIGKDGVARTNMHNVQGPVTVMGIKDDKSLPYCTVEVPVVTGAVVSCVAKQPERH